MQRQQKVSIIVVILLILLVGGYFGFQEFNDKNKQISDLESKLSSTQEELQKTEQEREYILDQFTSQQQRNDNLQERVEEAEEALGIIVKRQTTDPELLQKYSKVFFLNEHYQPEELDKISTKWTVNGREEYIYSKVEPFLKDMLEEAEDDGIDLRVISAFRSFDEQSSLKGHYTTVYGSGANQFSADQGYSEHQLGTTVDFSTEELGENFTQIGSNEAFKWLQDNAYKYGFTLSYPEGNSYYQYEPWHWRFVGRDLARYLDRNDMYFYDLDQRKIDEYIVELFD